MSHAFTQDVVHLLQDMACMMQNSESLDGLTSSDTGSHIFWILGRWMDGLLFCKYDHDGTQMGKKPTPWAMHPTPYSTLDGGRCTWLCLDTAQRGGARSFHLGRWTSHPSRWALDDDVMC
jgi:hypothetical protein